MVATNSRSYRTGTFLRFSNSNVESCDVSSSALSRYAVRIKKGEGTHDDHLFTIRPPERLGPPNLPWVPLHFKVFVTFRTAESERLGIVSDKHGTVSWVDIARAKVALFDTHLEGEGEWW